MQTVAAGTSIYAGFWRRVAAFILDGLILSLVELPLNIGFMGPDMWSQNPSRASGAYTISVVISWLYYSLLESSSKQATVGKMALGIIVTDMDGRRISFGRATGRHFAKILSGLILGIGFLMVAFTEKKQGLHDILAGTLVVKGTAPSSAGPTLPPPPPPPPV
jgi:uncharacterized RDD family membrane protein YckC